MHVTITCTFTAAHCGACLRLLLILLCAPHTAIPAMTRQRQAFRQGIFMRRRVLFRFAWQFCVDGPLDAAPVRNHYWKMVSAAPMEGCCERGCAV